MCPMHGPIETIGNVSAQWLGFDHGIHLLGPLLTPQDVLGSEDGLGGYSPCEIAQLGKLASHIVGYLPHRDPRVGRAGPVCPFTPKALRQRTMLLTAWRGVRADDASLSSSMLGLLDAFVSFWGPDDGHDAFRSVSVVIPFLDVSSASSIVQRVHDHLKPAFVSRGLMLGEFYPDCDAPGLHNPDFRPLRTPVPNLTIRPMTVNDEPFLFDSAENLLSYRKRFPSPSAD